MTVYFIGDGPLLPSLEHLVEYYCVYADGLETTLQYGLSPSKLSLGVRHIFVLRFKILTNGTVTLWSSNLSGLCDGVLSFSHNTCRFDCLLAIWHRLLTV
jgi:hypothetical protein